MNYGILIAVIAYELITILGVGFLISRREKHSAATKGESFILAGRGMGTVSFACTLALTILGAGHIWGACQNGWNYGSVAVWFGIGGVICICVLTQFTGPITRRLGVSTVPELVGLLYGEKMRTVVAVVTAPLMFGFLMLETQGLGITIAAITGWSVPVSALVGGILGILYVIFAGMKEISKLNIINAIVMYVGLIIVAISFAGVLPGGWAGVADSYVAAGLERYLNIIGDPGLVMSFAISTVLCFVCFHSISQMCLQPAMSARSTPSIKKSIWIAAPLNGLFCIIPACIGMAAKSDPAYESLGSGLAPAVYIVDKLPPWVVVLIMAAFLGALLSTFAMAALCPATLFAKDIYTKLYKPNATDAEQIRVIQIVIVILGAIAIAGSALQPDITTVMNWDFMFSMPIFVVVLLGLFWKSSYRAAIITLAVGWITNVMWTMTPLAGLLGTVHASYIVLPVSVVVGVLLTAVCPGNPGLFRMKQGKSAEKGLG